jgi:sugar lactone lactonase YvrE
MPVARPTSCTFGGTALDQLFVTSASIGLDQKARAMQPYAGGLFVLKPGVAGIADIPFAG